MKVYILQDNLEGSSSEKMEFSEDHWMTCLDSKASNGMNTELNDFARASETVRQVRPWSHHFLRNLLEKKFTIFSFLLISWTINFHKLIDLMQNTALYPGQRHNLLINIFAAGRLYLFTVCFKNNQGPIIHQYFFVYEKYVFLWMQPL